MSMKFKPFRCWPHGLLLCAGSVLAIVAWMRLIDPLLADWGTQAAERTRPLPGDDWVQQPGKIQTRAITIEAPPAQVWPWLLQLGAGRGGFYTFDWIECLRTQDHSAMKYLECDLQTLAPGDRVNLAKGLGLEVLRLDPDKALVLGSPDAEPHAWSWVFVLEPYSLQASRLLVRERYGRVDSLALKALNRLVASIDNLMSWKMLKGIKIRAERHVSR